MKKRSVMVLNLYTEQVVYENYVLLFFSVLAFLAIEINDNS